MLCSISVYSLDSSLVDESSYPINLSFKESVVQEDDEDEYYNNVNNNFAILPSFCFNYVPNDVTTRIDYTGPTKYQLGKYNKLMSYSYYPNHPITGTPRYIDPNVIDSIFNDPQINQYIATSGDFIVGYHKIVYYVNYQLKELVISVVPVNTTDPYYLFTCYYPENTASYSSYKIYDKDQKAQGDTIYIGNMESYYNLDAVAERIRYIQQNIFEDTLLPGHGSKSEWTFTLISKDTGNNAALNFLFKYYYKKMEPETVGRISRYKIKDSGYKYFQQLGFGDLLDKLLHDFTTTIGGNPNFFPENLIGKNIFMTVSQENDLLGTSRLTFDDPYHRIVIPRRTIEDIFEWFTLDKWHRNIVYTEAMNLVTDDRQYKCNKYQTYVGANTDTLGYSSFNSCFQNRTIKREYFGLPNYFYRYSIWRCTSEFECAFQPDEVSPIQYNNRNYNICTR